MSGHYWTGRYWSSHAAGARIARDVQLANDVKSMHRGPYYDASTGTLRVPSYLYSENTTPRANVEWKRRGLRYDGERQEWFIAVPAERAEDQVRKARAVFDQIWGFKREEES